MEIVVKKTMKYQWFFILIVFMVGFLWIGMPTIARAEDNSSTVPGNASYTEDAFYYSDQYMWKVSLYVAKADTVNKTTSTMNDFYRIGSQAVYIRPTASWSGWVAGSRPSNITNVFFTKESKVDTLAELASKGGNINTLDPVTFSNMGGVYTLVDATVPCVPQLNDGNIYDNGVIYGDKVGNINKVAEYFNNPNTLFKLLNFYAGKQGITKEALVQGLNLTINGETKTGWNPEGILPKVFSNENPNPTNQVEWLVVYEPVSIVYVKNTANPGSYYGYALTATDFAVTQIKHQMDWRYDETRFSAWAGQQPDAWKANGDRQHVAKLSHLILGNAVITNTTWYGLTSGNGVDQFAPVPNNRWTSENEIKYGGWGMARWLKPTTYQTPKDYEFRPNTDVVIACPVFSNIDAIPGSEITATYEIDGKTYTDKLLCPQKRVTTSYFKWHTPTVDTVTEYTLKISVSPYPKGTIQNGSEYVYKKIMVRPLEEKTPPDPKVDDKRPVDLPETVVVPNPPVTDDQPVIWDTALIKSVTEISNPPYNNGNKVVMEVHTNRATQTLDFKNLDTGEGKQLTQDALGDGVLTKYTDNPLTNEMVWTIEFTPKVMGINNYSFTPTNTNLGAGQSYNFTIIVDQKSIPDIISILRTPSDAEVNPKEPMTITILTNTTTDYLTIHSSLKSQTDQITPVTNYGDETVRGTNKKMDLNGDNKVDSDDLQILKDHVNGVCQSATIPCGICGSQDINGNGTIDASDVTLMENHIDGSCSLSDCYFHGTHQNRVIKNGLWEWTITYTPTVSGDETLTFIPYGTSDIAIVNGISKTISFTVKSPGRSLIEIFPDAGFAEDIRTTMNATRGKPINTIYEKVVTEVDLLSVTNLTSPNAKAITGVSELKNLILLNVSDGQKLTSIPAEIGLNTKLEVIYASNESLTTLPPEIGNLKALKIMHINGSKITSLPASMGGLPALWNFNVGNNLLTALPSELGDATNISSLVVNGNQIKSIPDNFSKLVNLTECNFADNKLEDISAFYTRMRNYAAGWNFNRQMVVITVNFGGNSAHTDIRDPGMNTPEVLGDMYQSYCDWGYPYQEARGVPSGLYQNVQFWNENTGATWKNGTDISGDMTLNPQRLVNAESGASGTSTIKTNAVYFDGSRFTFNYATGGGNPENIERVYSTGNQDSGSFNIAIRGFPGATSFPTWSDLYGQDDIVWYSTSNSANYYVSSANHSMPWWYHAHVYNGGTGLGAKNFKVSQAMHDGFYGYRNANLDICVRNPRVFGGLFINHCDIILWNTANGQDDLRWYEFGPQSAGWFVGNIPYGSHNQGGNYVSQLVLFGTKGTGFPSAAQKGKIVGEIVF